MHRLCAVKILYLLEQQALFLLAVAEDRHAGGSTLLSAALLVLPHFPAVPLPCPRLHSQGGLAR